MMHLYKISNESSKFKLFDAINLFLLLSLSGINFFNASDNFLLLVFFLNVGIFIYRKEKVDNGFLGFFLFFIFLSLAQVIWFSDGNIKSLIGFLVRILIAYLVIKNSASFLNTFLRLLFFLTVVSLFFYLFFLLFPSIEETLFVNKHIWDNPATHEYKKSLIIYNIFREPLFGIEALGLFGLPRNSGPFWEPGAFGGYLTIGVAFELILFRRFSRRMLVFLLALVTTFSTAGYLAVSVFFLLYFIFLETNKKRKILIFPVLVAISIFLLFNVEFMATKMAAQIKGFEEGQIYDTQSDDDTRLGSTILDWKDFQRSPIFGTGPSDETRYGKKEALFMRTNGLTDLVVRIGLLGFLFICIIYFRSLKNYFQKIEISKPKACAVILLFITFLISTSETYFNMPFFWSLFLLQYEEFLPSANSYEIIDD